MMIKNHIPNAVTCLNCLFGSLAVASCFGAVSLPGLSGLRLASLFVGLAAAADFLDGLLARLLGSVSPVGRELDSLSDLVSFGLAPSMMLLCSLPVPWRFAALLLPVLGALRLARFNVDTRQGVGFIGLPIPANAVFWVGFCDLLSSCPGAVPAWLSASLAALLGWLMVSPLPMFSLKARRGPWRSFWPQASLLSGSAALVLFLGLPGLSASVCLYVALSLASRPSS